MSFDNTLLDGTVLEETSSDDRTPFIKALNDKIAKDVSRVHAVQMNIGDGYTMVVKL